MISIVLSPVVVIVYAPYIQSKLNRFGREIKARQQEALTFQNAQTKVQSELQPGDTARAWLG